jgi:hypothetical protein
VKARILDRPDAFDQLKLACQKHLKPSEANDILDAYGLSDSPSAAEVRDGMCLIFSEMCFYLPALTALHGWRSSSAPKRADRYHFHVLNPFDGRFKDLASHEVDVTYLLQNFREHFSESDRNIARQMTDQVVGFVNGDGWAKQGHLVVFDEDGVKQIPEGDYDQMYRKGRGRLLEDIGHTRLWNVAEAWTRLRNEQKERAKI